MFVRNIVRQSGTHREARTGDGLCAHIKPVVVATAGALTIGVDAIQNGAAVFTGAAGAVAYTFPIATLLIAALPDMDIGDTYSFIVSNTAAQVATLTTAAGITLTGNVTINADARICVLEKLSATTVGIRAL